jgi:hypothetical protein
LGIPIIRKAFFKFSVMPFLIEAHLWIEKIELAPLIEITGVRGKKKYVAQQKQAKSERERAEKEKAAQKFDKITTEKALRDKKRYIAAEAAAAAAAADAAAYAVYAANDANVTATSAAVVEKAYLDNSQAYIVNSTWVEHDTLCGNEQCFTCGRAEEGAAPLRLECGDATSVISNITAALFGAAADQPDWKFTRTTEMCDSQAGPCTWKT